MSTGKLICAMCVYEGNNVQKVNHFLKVLGFARAIAEGEEVDAAMLGLIETAAVLHDVGIKPALEKYGSSAGPLQEKEGVAPAREILEGLSYPEETIARVCYLIAHHHTYTDIDGIDYQILVEADFLVNIFEGEMKKEEVRQVQENIFKTQTGTRLLKQFFL